MRKIELYWLVGTLVGVIVINVLLFGVQVLQLNGDLGLNVHDTYFVVSNSHLFMVTAGWVFFWVYLVRMFGARFRNITANSIFIVNGIFCIIILSLVIKPLNEYALSAGAGAHNLPINEDILNGVSLALSVFRIMIMVLVVLAMMKSRKQYIKNI